MAYATNTYKDSQFVLDKALAVLENQIYFAKASSRNFESEYKNLPYKTGRTIDYRIDTFFLGGDGPTINLEPYVERIRPLSITNQPNVGVNFTSGDNTFERLAKSPYVDMRLRPMMRTLANNIEQPIATGFIEQTSLAIGIGSVTKPDVFNNAIAKMLAHGIPMDGQVYCGVNLRVAAALANSLYYNTFNKEVNSMAFREGYIGEMLGLEFFRSQFLTQHVSGVGSGSVGADNRIPAGTIAVQPADGATSLSLSGFTASETGVIKKGDVIEITGVNSVNRVNKMNTGYLAQFVATDDVDADGSGNAVVPIKIMGDPIYWSNTNILQNVDSRPVVGAAVYIYNTHYTNVAYHKEALVVAMPPLAKLQGGVETTQSWSDELKASIRYCQGGIIIDDMQIERVDALLGFAVNPEFACRIMVFNV